MIIVPSRIADNGEITMAAKIVETQAQKDSPAGPGESLKSV
jgi:hypothetical protein